MYFKKSSLFCILSGTGNRFKSIDLSLKNHTIPIPSWRSPAQLSCQWVLLTWLSHHQPQGQLSRCRPSLLLSCRWSSALQLCWFPVWWLMGISDQHCLTVWSEFREPVKLLWTDLQPISAEMLWLSNPIQDGWKSVWMGGVPDVSARANETSARQICLVPRLEGQIKVCTKCQGNSSNSWIVIRHFTQNYKCESHSDARENFTLAPPCLT